MESNIWKKNLYQLFSENFPEKDHIFIQSTGGQSINYRELEKFTAQFSNALVNKGVKQGDRVLVQTKKSPEVVILYLACLRVGAIFVPLNTGYTESELTYFLDDAKPRLVVCDPNSNISNLDFQSEFSSISLETLGAHRSGTFIKLAERQSEEYITFESDGNDIACILYTSGTTGKPKGAMLSHANLGSNACTLKKEWGFNPEDILLHALPVFHAHGLFVAINTVLVNGTGMVFLPTFDVHEVIREMPRVTVMMGVPTFYTRLLEEDLFTDDSTKNIRLFISGSAPLLAETHNEFYDRVGHSILERYGMTETAMNTSNPLNGDRIPGSVGLALPGIDVRIVTDGKELDIGGTGNIEVRGPNVFSGYWRNPEKTAQEFCDDGYFRTGDIGYKDKNGYIFIVGRAKDLIISGGYNVYPKEVEVCLDEFNGIRESAVIGVPHKDFGEGVVAVVTSDNGKETFNSKKIISKLKEELAAYKVPKAIYLVDEIPRNVMGKVEKNKLRDIYKDIFLKDT
tara:strand:- start:74096 stop:75631 length:1536 start_codon:yes stop_codon:yes gene_type:complete